MNVRIYDLMTPLQMGSRKVIGPAAVVTRFLLDARGRGATPLSMSQQNLSQDDGIVVGLVMSRVDEGDSAVS